jgi:hypothetical protein
MNTPAQHQLRKAIHVVGKTLTFRDATVVDAEFILSLRTDSEKSRYLSAVTGELADQRAWLARLYDPQGDSFFAGVHGF